MDDDEHKQDPVSTAETTAGTSASAPSPAASIPQPAPEPERTLVMNPADIDKTVVMSGNDPERTIVLSPENGIERVGSGGHSHVSDTRAKIQTILHNPTSLLSSALHGFGGGGKRDVGAMIDGQDQHRERADVGRLAEADARLPELEDRYEIDCRLTEGARYAVSVGRDLGLEREVAVYSLRDEKLLDPEERANFLAEAEIAAQLDHPSILPIYSLSRDYRGGLHSAVKLTDGTDLRKYLNRIVSHYRSEGFRKKDEAASLLFRLELILGICDGLTCAHTRGVVHCNLHPHNILIGKYHEVYIKGWGFARFLKERGTEAAAARKPPELVDPRFVAPELIAGAEPDVLSDVYALGMLLYEIVTLHPPFPDDSAPEIIEKLRNGDTPPVEHRFGGAIDPDLRAVTLKAISPDPEKRYESVEALAQDIRKFLHSEETSARRISMSKKFAKLVNAHHRGMFLFFLTLIVLGGALAAYNIFNDVRTAQVSYLDDHVLGTAQAACRKTAHQFNLQTEKFNSMLDSIKFETEFLLSGHIESNEDGAQFLVPPDNAAVTSGNGIQTEFSPIYGDSVSFRKIEAGSADDLTNPEFSKLGLLEPTLFRYMLLAPVNAHITGESEDRQIHRLSESINPIHRIVIILKDGTSLHYPYTLKPESGLSPDTLWYRDTVTSGRKTAHWAAPVFLDENASSSTAETMLLPVSITLGPADAPIGGAALLLSGRHINSLLNDAENLSRGVVSQYFIGHDGEVKMERLNDGSRTLLTNRGSYPDPWLQPWLEEREFGAVIRKEPGGTSVYCCAYMPSMGFWYVEKIDLKRCLESLDKARKEAKP